jgi:hypothetical protein
MEGNLNDFLNSWKDISYDYVPVLSTKALKEIENLRCHIKKGCLCLQEVAVKEMKTCTHVLRELVCKARAK